MAVWTAIPDSDIDPDSPFTTALATAYRENVIAAFEGASGSPTIHPSSAFDDTITTEGSQSIGASSNWTPPQGFYNMAVGVGATAGVFDIYVSSAWRIGVADLTGAVICDGTNMRLKNLTGTARSTWWHRFDG
jgi:hypothetical protein